MLGFVIPGRHRGWRARNPWPSAGGYGFQARRGACHRAGRRPDPVATPRNDAAYDSNFEIALLGGDRASDGRDDAILRGFLEIGMHRQTDDLVGDEV